MLVSRLLTPRQEADECVVTLHDDEPSMVARMILWCYNGRYPVLWNDSTNTVSPTLGTMLQAGRGGRKLSAQETAAKMKTPSDVHLIMWVLADKYQMPDLASDAQASLTLSLAAVPEAFWSYLAQLEGLPDHIACELEKTIVARARAKAEHYLSDDRFKIVIEDHPKMAWEIVKVSKTAQKTVKW